MYVRKIIILLSLIVVVSCTSYNPVVDHRGSKDGVSKRYDDDLSTCRKIAKENINLEKNITRNISYNNLTDKFELKRYEDTLIKNLSMNIGDRIISILSNL